MGIKIDFVNSLPASSDMVRSFYAANWKRRIALSDKKFYDWQFINAPNNEKKDCCVIAYDEQKKEILGAMGLNKRRFYLNNKDLIGAELTTWVVNEKFEGGGFGAKILGFIQEKFEVLIGMGISDVALPIYMRSGFRYMKSIPRFVKVINFDSIKPYASYSNLATKLIKKWDTKITNNINVKEVSADDYDEIFNLVKRKVNLFERDNSHRIWRYEQHPYFRYNQYLVTSSDDLNSPKSFVVFREEKNLKEFKILHIIDLFGDEDSIPSAIGFVVNHAVKNSFDIIDFYCTASSVYRFMLGNGWFSINDDLCFQFPHLFHPIEMRNPPTTSLIYWARNQLDEMSDISRLYVSKQDADLDRPTMHTVSMIGKDSM